MKLRSPFMAVFLSVVISCQGAPLRRFTSIEEAQRYANTQGREGEEVIIAIPNQEEYKTIIERPEVGGSPKEPIYPNLKSAYSNQLSKMGYGTLDQTRRNVKSINRMIGAQNNFNIQTYRSVRKQADDAGNYVMGMTKEVPVVGRLATFASNWLVAPAAKVSDSIWEGARDRIEAQVQDTHKGLKKIKSFTKPNAKNAQPQGAQA